MLKTFSVLLTVVSSLLSLAATSSQKSSVGENSSFWTKQYSSDEDSPDVAFCKSLASTCPYLRNKQARPVARPGDSVPVDVLFKLISFVGIDDVQQLFSIRGTFWFNWQMPNCASWQLGNGSNVTSASNTSWPRISYDNITICFYDRSNVWHPVLRHYNAMSNPSIFDNDGREDIFVVPSGLASWRVNARFDSSCKLDYLDWPFDKQSCKIDVKVMDEYGPTFSGVSTQCDNTAFDESIWNLINVTASLQDSGSRFHLSFHVARISLSYIATIFIPNALLSLLQLSALLMPANYADRTSFSVTVVLAMAVQQSMFSNFTPVTPNILKITVYFQNSMAVGVLITIYTMITSRLLKSKTFKAKVNFFRWKAQVIDFVDIAMFFLSAIAFLAVFISYFTAVSSPSLLPINPNKVVL